MQPYVDWFDFEDSKHPLSSAPEPKRRFLSSKWEHKKVNTLEHYVVIMQDNWAERLVLCSFFQ